MYYSPMGWKAQPDLATNFGSIGEAVCAAFEANLLNVEIVLRFDDKPSAYDLHLPLTAHQPPSGRD